MNYTEAILQSIKIHLEQTTKYNYLTVSPNNYINITRTHQLSPNTKIEEYIGTITIFPDKLVIQSRPTILHTIQFHDPNEFNISKITEIINKIDPTF